MDLNKGILKEVNSLPVELQITQTSGSQVPICTAYLIFPYLWQNKSVSDDVLSACRANSTRIKEFSSLLYN